ncbi:carboxypeptidase regulatory-like domain-containing protein [Terriglobus sp. RCC_193]|uniref:TonB-dependent receptor n=1 Tax=Terriglobus sp. RCC_193 TaxID=3239218 RepID=UPI003526AEA6
MPIATIAILLATAASAQKTCADGVRVDGTVSDQSGASVVGAVITGAGGDKSVTDASGHYVLPCQPKSFVLHVQAEGFAEATVRRAVSQAGPVRLDIKLSIASVSADVQVTANDRVALDPDRGSGTVVLDSQLIKQLADDPDDFLRQLQALASESGGNPTTAVITVDGFQSATVLPPKGSIASIHVNPDLFSTEYRWPPYGRGLIEIVTKPGASSLHGATFFTGSSGSWNATTAFAPTSTPASKRRYGFELSGTLVPNKGDFSMALEKRDIDEFKVVNAQILQPDYTIAPFRQTVATPQRLWMGSLRSGWQLGKSDTLTTTFAANVNSLGNQGVSALVLPEAGYSNFTSQYDLRFANALTVGPNQLHQTRVGLTWWRTQNTPNSTTPSLQVSGYFTGGGATSQNLNNHGFNLEVDHDVLLTRGKSSLKMGVQALATFTQNYTPDTFNGAWLFGGGGAPVLDSNNLPTSQTITIDGMEQYRRTLLGLAGGVPTRYQISTGNPVVPFTRWNEALYVEETLQASPRLTIAGGLRYQMQTAPSSFANFEPRISLAWSADKRSRWVFHTRAGIFQDVNEASALTNAFRLNGVRQQQTTVYSPNYTAPLVPTADSIAVSSMYEFAPGLSQKVTVSSDSNVEYSFGHQWLARASFYWGEDWNTVRMRNINAPMVAASVGTPVDPTAALHAPRPYGGNEDILRFENSGHLAGHVAAIALEQNSYKRFQIHARYRHMIFKADGGDGIVSPQSSYSEQGESSRVDWLNINGATLFANVVLPEKLELSGQFSTYSGSSYNITTGTDGNGDGILNDRPSYASAPGSGVYSTRYGLMTANTVNGNVPRNVGTMPPMVHLDMNLSRAFVLNPKDTDHLRTFTFNVRSANILNHTNVNGVGTVISSPSVDKPYQAEPARRIEMGARFSF